MTHFETIRLDIDAAGVARLTLARTDAACAPGAVQTTKKLVQFVPAHDSADNPIYTVDRLADFWKTEEAHEGLKSFFEKRAPAWRRKHEPAA